MDQTYHSETDDCGVETIYQVSSDIDSYSEGWKYFCLILPAKAWKSTQFTICFYKNIGTLSIDGLQLTRNDVQSRKYDSEGSLTSSYTALKTDSYTYDTYKRTKKHTTAAGAYYINTYENNNELKKVEASIGPDTYYTYDKYGNQTSRKSMPGNNCAQSTIHPISSGTCASKCIASPVKGCVKSSR